MNDVTSFFNRLQLKYSDLLLFDDRCMARPEPDFNKIDSMGADVVIYSSGYGKYVDLGFGGFAHLIDSVNYWSYCDVFKHDDLLKITEL